MHTRHNSSPKRPPTALAGGLLILVVALSCAWRACRAPELEVSDSTRFHAPSADHRVEITTTFEDGTEAAFMPYDLIADYPEGPSPCKVPEIAFYENREPNSDSPTPTTRNRLPQAVEPDCVIVAPIPRTPTLAVFTDEHGRLLLDLKRGAAPMYVLPADRILSEEGFYPGLEHRRWGRGPVYPAIRGDIREHLGLLAADHQMKRTPWKLEVTLPGETPRVTVVGMTAFGSCPTLRVRLHISIKGREHTRTVGLGEDGQGEPSIILLRTDLPVSPDPIHIPIPIIGRGPSRKPVAYGEIVEIHIMVVGESFYRSIYKGVEVLRPGRFLSVDVAPFAKRFSGSEQ